MKIILDDSLVGSMKKVFNTNDSFVIGGHHLMFTGYSLPFIPDEEITFTADVIPHIQPQFQNGDTVYDDDGIELTYVAPHPRHPELSIITKCEMFIPIRTSKLTKTPPVTPKDGEWWMCELVEKNMEITQTFHNVLRFSNDWEITGYPKNKIKPLYRMIRDNDTE